MKIYPIFDNINIFSLKVLIYFCFLDIFWENLKNKNYENIKNIYNNIIEK